MTVASLWKALDRAGCGRPVGMEELLDLHQLKKGRNPWNYSIEPKSRPPTLAVDLSIWICESLTSSAIAEQHSDPTMQLVFARTLKLLTLGVKVIGVIEGKRRIQHVEEAVKLQKRRSGTRFWHACKRCEELYSLLGVPIVRAKAEGEALCALLNERGIVDGVISNDGDCFLFGAKVLYTKFSNENLQNRAIMRYDAKFLEACLDDDDSDKFNENLTDHSSPLDNVKLSRSDLIAFAILTGSDVAGSGLPKVGCRKALRFVRKCQLDNPLKPETAALNEMISWSKAAKAQPVAPQVERVGKHCSLCCHAGSKSCHLKNGCELCGTGPGESCFQLSQGGKFRKSLRKKAMAMVPRFDPESIAHVYRSPNDDQVPLILANLSAEDVMMKMPDLQGFLKSSLLVRGRSLAESRSYVLQSLSRLMARAELSNLRKSKAPMDRPAMRLMHSNKNKPVPTKIIKAITRSGVSCYELLWRINATTTDYEGNPIDEFEFSTSEKQSIIKKNFPELVEKFTLSEKDRLKQGNAEQEKRKAFLDMFTRKPLSESKINGPTGRTVLDSTIADMGRRESTRKWPQFQNFRQGHDHQRGQAFHLLSNRLPVFTGVGDDAAKLLQETSPSEIAQGNSEVLDASIDSVSTLSSDHCCQGGTAMIKLMSHPPSPSTGGESPYKIALTPAHLHFLGSQYETIAARNKRLQGCLSEKQKTLYRQEFQDSSISTNKTMMNFDILDERQLPSNGSELLHSSPCIKRSKFVGPGGTPPMATNLPIHTNGSLLDSFRDCRPGAQSRGGTGCDCLGLEAWMKRNEDYACIDNGVTTDFPRSCSVFPSKLAHESKRYQEGSFCMTRSFELPASNVDETLLIDSFAGASLHSKQELYSVKNVPCLPENTSDSNVNGKWLKPAFYEVPNILAPPLSAPTLIAVPTPLGMEELGLVEAAMANYELKTRLARMDSENCQLLRDNMWQEHYGF